MHVIRGRALTQAVAAALHMRGESTARDLAQIVPTDAITVAAALTRLEDKGRARRCGKTPLGQILWRPLKDDGERGI